ncbi:Uncharacterized protein QTN25_010225 [Entamoeba marina]
MLLLLLLIQLCKSNDYHVVFISVTAPKKIPVLKYTANYFINAYKYGHDGIKVDGMFLTKGCEKCKHPILDEAYNMYEKAGMNPVKLSIEHPQILTKNNSWNYYERYHPYYNIRQANGVSLRLEKKYLIVNHYTHNSGILAFEMFPNADYIVFLEDDVAVYKNFFPLLKQLLDQFDENRYSLLKLATHRNLESNGDVSKKCIWGWWGITMSKSQFERYIRFEKASEYTECGDSLVCYLSRLINKNFQVNKIMYHFGKDRVIPERIDKYYNGIHKL